MAEPAEITRCSLVEEINALTPRDDYSGRRAKILIKEDDLRVTLVTMRAEAELDEHSAPASVNIHVLTGTFDVSYEGGPATLDVGDMLALRKDALHSVRCVDDGAFLLTLGWSADQKERDRS